MTNRRFALVLMSYTESLFIGCKKWVYPSAFINHSLNKRTSKTSGVVSLEMLRFHTWWSVHVFVRVFIQTNRSKHLKYKVHIEKKKHRTQCNVPIYFDLSKTKLFHPRGVDKRPRLSFQSRVIWGPLATWELEGAIPPHGM